MSRNLRFAGWTLWFVAIILLSVGLTTAQERDNDKTEAPRKQPTAKTETGTTLVLMVRTKSNLTESEIKRTLVQGLKKAKCAIAGAPTVERISPEMYEKFETIINQTATPSREKAPRGQVSVRLLPTREPLWEFRLSSSDQLLKKLVVHYRKAGVRELVPSTKKDSELMPIVAGRYSLRVPKGDEPTRYEATILNMDPSVKEVIDKQRWPRQEKFFVITMRAFQGTRTDRDRLFEVIKDHKQVKKPLDDITIGRDFQFVFGSVESGDVKPGTGEDRSENTLTVQVGTLPNRSVQRVWMLMPLQEEKMREQRDHYRKFDDAELSQEIRKSKPVAAGQKIEIGPDTPPTWIELSSADGGKTFGRVLSLKNPVGLDDKYKHMWRLLVWEYDDDGEPSAHEVSHPDPEDDGVYHLRDEEIKAWSRTASPKDSGAKKKDKP